jgi:hypothetical protein
LEKQHDAPPPVAEESEDPVWTAVKKGARWGSIGGLAVGQLLISSQSISTPFGSIYGGNILLALGIPICIGAAIGAALGWLSTRDVDDDNRSPPVPPLDQI